MCLCMQRTNNKIYQVTVNFSVGRWNLSVLLILIFLYVNCNVDACALLQHALLEAEAEIVRQELSAAAKNVKRAAVQLTSTLRKLGKCSSPPSGSCVCAGLHPQADGWVPASTVSFYHMFLFQTLLNWIIVLLLLMIMTRYMRQTIHFSKLIVN